MADETTETFGRMIWRLRRARRWTQEDLAERSGLDQSTISTIELDKGKRTVGTVTALAAAFGAEAHEWIVLAGLVPPPKSPPPAATPEENDHAFDPASIVAYVEAHPDPHFHRELLEMRDELLREDYVGLCIDTYRAWTSNGHLGVASARRGLHRR